MKGYPHDQQQWVDTQRYQEADWEELVGFWRLYNRHLARVMAAVPEVALVKEHRNHNLHQIAWRTVSETEPATLEYLMSDYVGHLRHHLGQIVGEVAE